MKNELKPLIHEIDRLVEVLEVIKWKINECNNSNPHLWINEMKYRCEEIEKEHLKNEYSQLYNL